MTAPSTPTDHALQEPSTAPILTHDWSTTVGVAWLNGARFAVPCAEHGVCYRNTSILVVFLTLRLANFREHGLFEGIRLAVPVPRYGQTPT